VVIINYRAITPTEEPTESQTRGMCPTIFICLSDEVIVCTVIKKKAPFRKLRSLHDIHSPHLLVNTRRV